MSSESKQRGRGRQKRLRRERRARESAAEQESRLYSDRRLDHALDVPSQREDRRG